MRNIITGILVFLGFAFMFGGQILADNSSEVLPNGYIECMLAGIVLLAAGACLSGDLSPNNNE
ncbi:MAG: hypothetical protein ACI4Q4_02455 [Oscillospiraceae bacterium]